MTSDHMGSKIKPRKYYFVGDGYGFGLGFGFGFGVRPMIGNVAASAFVGSASD